MSSTLWSCQPWEHGTSFIIPVLEDTWLCPCLSVWACDPIYGTLLLLARSCVYFQLDYKRNIPISIYRWQSTSSQLLKSSAARNPQHHYWFPLMLRKSGSRLQPLHKGLRKVMLNFKVSFMRMMVVRLMVKWLNSPFPNNLSFWDNW